MGAHTNFTIPFELTHGFLIVVHGYIGPLGPLKFILDTGATNSMVDIKIAERLALPLENGRVLNLDRQAAISWTRLPDLQVGLLQARNLRVTVGTLSRLSELAEGLDGVLGLDLLTLSSRMQINFSTMQIIFSISDKQEPSAAVSRPPATLVFSVPLSIYGESLRVVVDTGAHDLFLFEDRLRRHVRQKDWTNIGRPASAGQVPGKLVHLAGLKAANVDLDGSVFLMERAPSVLPENIDGFLGISCLHASIVDFDFKGGTLRFGGAREPVVVTADSDVASQPDMSGAVFMRLAAPLQR